MGYEFNRDRIEVCPPRRLTGVEICIFPAFFFFVMVPQEFYLYILSLYTR